MWCANCEEDVATEISGDGQALKCITCGEQVRQVFAPSLHPETKSARDLLQKWAEEQKQQSQGNSNQILPQAANKPVSKQPLDEPETQQSLSSKPVDETAVDSPKIIQHAEKDDQPKTDPIPKTATTEQTQREEKAKPKFRVDGAHQTHQQQPPIEPKERRPRSKESIAVGDSYAVENNSPSEEQAESMSEHASRQYTSHDAHNHAPSPHFDVVAASKRVKSRPGRSEAIWGQLLAYAGVGVLTVGTVLVLWGYFGMIEQYASTGWLLSTAGQMLLLLGIVTLVSGGMQQTTHEVSERIEYLGGRMIRIEQSTDQILNGPHFANQKSRPQSTSLENEDKNSA